jgi:hypothetical protein
VRSKKLYLSVLSLWLGLTCLVDFIVVPTVFRNVSSRAEAGDIGMIVFSLINKVEFICALIVIICGYFFRKQIKRRVLFFVTLSSLILLTFVYNVHMTPEVRKQTLIMREESEGSKTYLKAEQTHHFYHNLYKKTDGVKILVILMLLGAGILKKESEV